MTTPRPSLFRDALQVSRERIATLADTDLNSLMNELFLAQAYRCGAAVGEVRVNTEGRAEDAGCDGWTPKPASSDAWFGATPTCWQFKAGTAGQPARLHGEVTKPLPRDTLIAGGRFVLVASASSNGKKGEEDRLQVLILEAKDTGLPMDNIDVIGSERLADWCNQHPATAARYAGRPDGLWLLDEWLHSPDHQVPWQSTQVFQDDIQRLRGELDLATGHLTHLHVRGAPGVGKTRFALELCREADWRSTVIYIRQASDLRLIELIDSATADKGALLTVVADEVQREQLLPLCDSLTRGHGRVRLITIGHSSTPDPARIPALKISPLPMEAMTGVIKGWHPAMPLEHVDFVTRFADGYVRLAKLAAAVVMENSSVDVRTLLNLDHIRDFFDRMLGTASRRPLHVVAALNSVGWTDDRQSEGEAVARHLGLDWNSVRDAVEDFHDRFGIAPRGGRYRYVSPTPLGIYLAVEAWTRYPDLMKSLADALPTEGAKDAYYERLQQIASNPQVSRFAREQLSFFFQFDHFLDARNVRRWSALSAADPALAAHNVMKALSSVDSEKRLRIRDEARRDAVWTLVRLAWKTSAFHDALIALALLAEAENETWGNNATGEFINRFQVFLGGTAVPYTDRLGVLDELLATERPALTKLVVRALAQIGNDRATRTASKPISDELPEREWQPTTHDEHRACFEGAINRLTKLAKAASPDIMDEFMAAAQNLVMLLRMAPIRDSVADFFRFVRTAYPEKRETLRRMIAGILRRERKYWKTLSEPDLTVIEKLRAEFEDNSLHARLLQEVGQHSWDREFDPIDVTSLARELAENPEALASEWRWLTSGEAAEAWLLGQALAEANTQTDLDTLLPSLEPRGHDLRILCGYLKKRREQLGNQWFDQWVTTYATCRPVDIPLLIEICWRCGATRALARQVSLMLREHDVDHDIIGGLGFGTWAEDLPIQALAEVVNTLADRGHESTAIAIVENRLITRPNETDEWEETALRLVTNRQLIRTEGADHYWHEIAKKLTPRHGKRIAAAIFREQADRKSGTWFAHFSSAAEVLYRCVEVDPSGVWDELVSYLSSANAYSFAIGFPPGIVDRVPADRVNQWVSEAIKERASVLAHFVSMDFSNDDTMASRLLGSFGDDEGVSSAFFSQYASGSWSGPASTHWLELADRLTDVANRTSLPKLRAWTEKAIHSLHGMAESDRQREEEWDLRRH